MRYALWSRGRLVGHTDLDVQTITPTMRQGFIEPTPEGVPILEDATGVWRALAAIKRATRERGGRIEADDMLFAEAVRRREDLHFELLDENGVAFEHDFIRVFDLADSAGEIVDEMCDTEEEDEAAFQIALSALSAEEQEKALVSRVELIAEVDEMVAEINQEREEEDLFGAAWPPPPPPDPRWDTMPYLMQVHMKGDHREDPAF